MYMNEEVRNKIQDAIENHEDFTIEKKRKLGWHGLWHGKENSARESERHKKERRTEKEVERT